MPGLRLLICVTGVYSTFLLWAIAQERLSQPFPSYPHHSERPRGDAFPSTTFINACQAVASCASALVYLVVKRLTAGGAAESTTEDGRQGGAVRGLLRLVGWDAFSTVSPRAPVEPSRKGEKTANGNGLRDSNGNGPSNGLGNGHSAGNGLGNDIAPAQSKAISRSPSPSFSARINTARKSLPLLLIQVSACQTLAAPIGFASLRYISYPTMVLGKSCKLIPVLLLNVLIYRRRFKPYKYAVVALVSAGISLFMLMGPPKAKGKAGGGGGGDSSYGLALLGINLLIDGLTNSTQDEIFSLHPGFTGQQMMFTMSFLSLVLTLPLLLLPPGLPAHLLDRAASFLPFVLPTPDLSTSHAHDTSPLAASLRFVQTHPACLGPLARFALLGGLGQLFIFETISHFGSLTLVMLTVTRKLFTMLLSVVLFNHQLTRGQWAGVAVVFGGIGLEAAMKRREILDKQIAAEQHKSRLKAL